MSSSGTTRPRSGDPRKRAAAGSPSHPRTGRRRAVAVALALAAATALVSLAAVSARPDRPGTTAAGAQPDPTIAVDAQTLMHAEVACDLTSKAEQAAAASDAGQRARYAAAVLLLDHAIIESGRAARYDTRLAGLDAALQAVHTSGHEGDHDEWQHALRTAHTECRTALG